MNHRCHMFNKKVFITGGGHDDTEIIEMDEHGKLSIRTSSKTNLVGDRHGMGIININNSPELIVFGGNTDSIEIWNDTTETWMVSDMKLKRKNSGFGFSTFATNLLCPESIN